MLLKLSCHPFKLDFLNFRILNVTFMVTTKKLSVQYTYKKLRRDSKHFTTQKKSTERKIVMEKNEGWKDYWHAENIIVFWKIAEVKPSWSVIEHK